MLVRVFNSDVHRKVHINIVRNGVDIDGDNGNPDYENEIVQAKDYYPFGLEHRKAQNIINGRNHEWAFANKEFNKEFGLNWYDFGARNYQADLGRWMNIDAYAESFYDYSPYMYAMNNPIMFVDPDGNFTTRAQSLGGNDSQVYSGGIAWGNTDKGTWETIGKGKIQNTGTGDIKSGDNAKSLINNSGSSKILNGVKYSYYGDAPEKISFHNDSSKTLLTGIIEWAAYINSGNKAHLTDILKGDDKAPSDLNLDAHTSRNIYDKNNDRIHLGYMAGYLSKNNAFSSHIINYVYLNDYQNQNHQISFLTSMYKGNKKPVVMWVRGKGKFISRVKGNIKYLLDGHKYNWLKQKDLNIKY